MLIKNLKRGFKMLLKKPLKFPIQIQKNIEQRIREGKITTIDIDDNKCGNCGKVPFRKSALFCRNCGFLFINRFERKLA